MARSMLVVFALVGMGCEGEIGTVIVTSSPTDRVEIFLDGLLVGKRTPVTLKDVAVGRHELEAKAPGFKRRKYMFKVAFEEPTIIPISLERTGGGQLKLELESPSDPPIELDAELDARMHYQVGTNLLREAELEAIEQFRECIEADPKYCKCYRAMGIGFARVSYVSEAVEYYRQYLKQCPDAPDAAEVKQLLEAYGP